MNDRATSRWILAASVAVKLAIAFLLLGWVRPIVARLGVAEVAEAQVLGAEGADIEPGLGVLVPALILFGLVALAASYGALVAAVQRAAMRTRPPGWISATVTSAITACSSMVSLGMVVLVFVPTESRWTMIAGLFYAIALVEGLAILARQHKLLAASAGPSPEAVTH